MRMTEGTGRINTRQSHNVYDYGSCRSDTSFVFITYKPEPFRTFRIYRREVVTDEGAVTRQNKPELSYRNN